MSDLQTIVRTDFAAILSDAAQAAATVKVGAISGTGLLDTTSTDAGLSAQGEEGRNQGTVWVSIGTFTSEPTRGSVVYVGGKEAFVANTQIDPVGALMRIDYSKTHPVTI